MIPLVIVHGFMGGSAQWTPQAPLAEAQDLICVDLPGFGANAHLTPINRIEDFAAWVLDEVTHQGHKRFHQLGHSMGGMIVQDMVRLAPERIEKLVLYGTGAAGVLPGRFETIETSMLRATQDGAQATARRISATWFLDQKASHAYSACADLAERTGLPAILSGLEAMQHWSGVDHLKQITQPTLVVWGDGDRTYSWPQIEQLWTQIPKCNLAVVPHCAHAVHAENPSLFNLLITDFMST